MTKKKTLKKALLSSVLALVLCFTMLIGTTYAWFTDSVTSSGNIIKSGTLNIDLGIKTGTDDDYVSVKENPTKKAFDYDKWEPGYTEWVNAKVTTTGNLALKYTMKIKANGAVSALAEVIDVYYKPEEVAILADGREASLAQLTRLGTLADALAGTIVINDTLIPGTNDADFATLALHMQESAGNEYQDKSIGTDFSLQILATQFTYEEDSFDELYDELAEYPRDPVGYNAADPTEVFYGPEDLHAAFADGKNVTLTSDADISGYDWTPVTGYAGTFDGAGFTLSGLTISAPEETGGMFTEPADGATIKNLKLANVNVSGKYVAAVVGDAETTNNLTLENIEIVSGSVTATGYAAGIAFDVEGNNVKIKDCVNRADITSDFSASGIGAWVTASGIQVSNVKNYGKVIGGNRAGGIFGNFGNGTVTAAENHGEVKSTGGMPAGGIVGVLSGASTLDHCLNTGSVTTTENNINASAAGILGQTPSAAATIKYCINTGVIKAENSYAGGIATGLYGGSTSQYCYNSGSVTGNNTVGGNPKYAAGGIAPKASYGSGDKSQHCLNSGVILADTNGQTCQLTYSNITASYYYDNAVLKTSAGADADPTEALAALNDGAEETFFVLDGGEIKPAALVG